MQAMHCLNLRNGTKFEDQVIKEGAWLVSSELHLIMYAKPDMNNNNNC